MKLVLMSDTHGKHAAFDPPPGDVLIHAGDFMNSGNYIEEILSFSRWLGTIRDRYKEILVIAGNHDRMFEDNPLLARQLLKNCTYLQNESVVIDGLKFYGAPQTPEFNNWAFNVKRGEDLRRYWDAIPSDTDVLITHGPPIGVLDTSVRGGPSLGCADLLDAVYRVRPRLHVFGHIHGGAGECEWPTGPPTGFVNASMVDEAYQPVHQPIVIGLSE